MIKCSYYLGLTDQEGDTRRMNNLEGHMVFGVGGQSKPRACKGGGLTPSPFLTSHAQHLN